MSRPLTVAVTGASGHLGAALIRELAGDRAVGRILGFDVRPPRESHPKLVFDAVDVRSPALTARLQGVDCLFHLAFVVSRAKDDPGMRDVNVNGSQNVFGCAGRAGSLASSTPRRRTCTGHIRTTRSR